MKITKTKFTESVKGSGGVQAVVAQRLGTVRSTITMYIQKNLWAAELLHQEREKIIDLAENKLFKAADEGKQWAIERILKNLGKNRGYTEKQEIESIIDIGSTKSIQQIYTEMMEKKTDEESDNQSNERENIGKSTEGKEHKLSS